SCTWRYTPSGSKLGRLVMCSLAGTPYAWQSPLLGLINSPRDAHLSGLRVAIKPVGSIRWRRKFTSRLPSVTILRAMKQTVEPLRRCTIFSSWLGRTNLFVFRENFTNTLIPMRLRRRGQHTGGHESTEHLEK